MADTSQRQSLPGSGTSLLALLESIDREIQPALVRDMELGKERAARNIRRKKPYIAFTLGAHEMALPVDSVQEIGEMPTVTPLPNLPPWIKGIIQNRGEILSVVDFMTLFGIEEKRSLGARRSCLFFKWYDLRFCLPVGRIMGIVNIDEQRDNLQPVEALQANKPGRLSEFVKGVFSMDNRNICLLDNEKLGTSSLIRKWR